MIKFNEILKEKEYRERLIKYFRLPMRLSVSEEKFMSDLEFIKLTEPTKYAQIVELTEKDFNKEAAEQKTRTPDFTMEHILEPLIEELESQPRWQEFLKVDNSNVLEGYEGVTNIHGFYKKENHGKHFLSVDLEAANWQSLQTILDFDKSYEELIVEYTDNVIPPVSKTFRTKITGILGAKQIMDFNKKLLKDNQVVILESIKRTTGVDLVSQIPFAFYADEFLIEIDEATKDKLQSFDLSEVESDVYEDTGIGVHLTPFTLEWLDIDKSCIKLYKDGKYEILNISKDVLLIINKLLHDVQIEDIDFEKIKLGKLTKEDYVSQVHKKIEFIKELK